jgi:hypothetical protein
MSDTFIPGRPLTLQEEEDIQKYYACGEKMYSALQTLLRSEKLKCLLEVNDQMAYSQCRDAVKQYEDHLYHL